ncbi:glycosyltransferase family 25 protein [Conchiformibius steedae]|uniref:Glycosyltransferase family 25 protein n=2 Tax=Conchiformibius steedae TaxID=153493 RepID=A0A3P2A361_9NEIS|nr:glycosyltransferase family 25 protein [Conchiformibius steedae]
MINIYAISLPDHIERRHHIQAECARVGIAAEIIDATDMRAADESSIHKLCKLPLAKPLKKQRYLSAGELGCSLSHRAVYQTVLARGQDYALILEDDAYFIEDPSVLLNPDYLQTIQQQYPFDVLILGYVKTLPEHLPYYYRRIPLKTRATLTVNDKLYRFGTPWEQYGCGTVAYIISAQGARKLLADEKPSVAADDWLYFEQQNGLRILHSRPAFVLEDATRFDSTIRQEPNGFLQPKRSSIIIRSTKGWLKNFAMNYLNLKK